MLQDEQIIDLYWARSERAIEESGVKYGAYCRTIAWNVLYSREDSEECVNDTWMNAWNAMPPQRPSILRAFLGRITRNLALNRYERDHAEKRGKGETAAVLDELSECVPDRAAEIREEGMLLREVLDRFLEGMKPEERKLFVGRYWYLRPVKELADTYGFSESKVKMTLLRSREKLKQALLQEGIAI